MGRAAVVAMCVAAASCGGSRLAAGVRFEAAGQYPQAAAEYEACIRERAELDCRIALAELYGRRGPLADCRHFVAIAAEAKARHDAEEPYFGPHARERLSARATSDLQNPEIRSLADWFAGGVGDCRLREGEKSESRDVHRQQLLEHPCGRLSLEAVEAMTAAQGHDAARSCDDFRKRYIDNAGTDRAIDAAIASGLAAGALAALDEAPLRECSRPPLRALCKAVEVVRPRMWKRARGLATAGPAGERLPFANLYLKRWPRGPDVPAMKVAAERATLDVALEPPKGRRLDLLESFLRAFPSSTLRQEALAALWPEALEVDTLEIYRDLVARYPDAQFQSDAKDRLAEKEVDARIKKKRPVDTPPKHLDSGSQEEAK
ncbi:MAG: hypothetical protein EXR72_06895 [Myxococcales bacterium]|nr:hypothetical protein [Myxococcales bacterium]